MQHLDIVSGSLTSAQQEKLHKLNSHNIYKAIHFVETQHPEAVQEGGLIELDLPYLDCPNLLFAVANVEVTDGNNYQWYGQVVEDPDDTDTLCSSGSLTVMKNNGLFIGHITLDNRSFELYDLTGGVQALCETDFALLTADECETGGEIERNINYQTGGDPCHPVTTRVLVLFTPAADLLEPDMAGKANLAISQLNNIWANSGINNRLLLASVQPLSFTENSFSIEDDVRDLSNNSVAQALRLTHNADIVILLTAPVYPSTYGVVRNIGGSAADAFAIVGVTIATTSRYTFAHEVTHLYGGRHDNDNTPGDSHGYTFRASSKKRYTLMAVFPNDSRIEHVSNPNIDFKGKPTGTKSEANNAKTVNSLKYHVANFLQDPPVTALLGSASVYYYLNSCRSEGVVKFDAFCGTQLYNYQWYASEDGFNWVAKGTGSAEPFSVPANNANRRFYFMKVVVTDANNNTVTSTVGIRYFCIAPPDPDLNRLAPTHQKNPEANSISFYPNPTNGKFKLVLPANASGAIRVQIKELSVRTVATIYDGVIDEETKHLDLDTRQHQFRGLYLLQVEVAGKIDYRKIIFE